MRDALEALVGAVGEAVPHELASVADGIAASPWPEVVGTWSRLTPTGFPVELSVTEDRSTLRWTAEIAGPEVVERERLARVAAHLAVRGQPVPAAVLAALQRLQTAGQLRYGAWIGGRSDRDGACRFKLYAEAPPGAGLEDLPLPERLRRPLQAVPPGAIVRVIGHEPCRERTEVYVRLPGVDVEALGPLLAAAGQPAALGILDRVLPDGRDRLRGRRLGLSLAATPTSATDVTLVVSARTLFPGSPDLVDGLVPALAGVPQTFRRTLVSLVLDPGGGVHWAVGLTAPTASHGSPGLH